MLAGNKHICCPCFTGTFSHAYEEFLAIARKNERDHPELYKLRNERFKKEFGFDIPPLPDKYAHENTSLTMVDFVLANLGKIQWHYLRLVLNAH